MNVGVFQRVKFGQKKLAMNALTDIFLRTGVKGVHGKVGNQVPGGMVEALPLEEGVSRVAD